MLSLSNVMNESEAQEFLEKIKIECPDVIFGMDLKLDGLAINTAFLLFSLYSKNYFSSFGRTKVLGTKS
jgi:NAD-dependent DNA ligase